MPTTVSLVVRYAALFWAPSRPMPTGMLSPTCRCKTAAASLVATTSPARAGLAARPWTIFSRSWSVNSLSGLATSSTWVSRMVPTRPSGVSVAALICSPSSALRTCGSRASSRTRPGSGVCVCGSRNRSDGFVLARNSG